MSSTQDSNVSSLDERNGKSVRKASSTKQSLSEDMVQTNVFILRDPIPRALLAIASTLSSSLAVSTNFRLLIPRSLYTINELLASISPESQYPYDFGNIHSSISIMIRKTLFTKALPGEICRTNFKGD